MFEKVSCCRIYRKCNGRCTNGDEIQRNDKGAGVKRARYKSSVMDVNILDTGEEFEKLSETYVIFITENDVLGKSKPLYPVERCIMLGDETVSFGDGSHILYVNGAYRRETPLGKLMHDFSCTDPSDMNYKELADRTRFFKEDEEIAEYAEISVERAKELAGVREARDIDLEILDHIRLKCDRVGLPD